MMKNIDIKALWDVSYGLYVITSHKDSNFNGQIANAVMQVTAQPNQIAISLNNKNLTCEYVKKSGVFAVSILEQEVPMQFIGLFGFKTGRDIDKLAQVKFIHGKTGCPCVIENTLSMFELEVKHSLDIGTHCIFVGEVVAAKVLKKGISLTYAYYQTVKKGKSPKNAPTFKGEVKKEEISTRSTNVKKYRCDICGYVYDPAKGDPESGIEPGTAFEDIPDDWVCPICGAGKDDFSEV